MARFRSLLVLFMLAWMTSLQAAEVTIVTYYNKTGGYVGTLNQVGDQVNGRDICPADPTAGCDFDDDPGYSNNGTVDNTDDDYYTGDLLVRTHDWFKVGIGWSWSGDVGKDEVNITSTLPVAPDGGTYYEWLNLPSGCDTATSGISEDGQTITCIRKDFDTNSVGNHSEDLYFFVRVRGSAPNGTKPGDMAFRIEAEGADAAEDDTDNNSLIITAAPRWNLQKPGVSSIISGYELDIDGDGVAEKGWLVDYFYSIEVDEVTGEEETINPIVGNESMGEDANFTFTDDFSGMPPGTTLIDCSMNGRYSDRNGIVSSTYPISYYGSGSYLPTSYPERHILALKDDQKVTCTQSGSEIKVELEHINTTLDHYPTETYTGVELPTSRAIAALGNIYLFVPYEAVRVGANGTDDNCSYTEDSSCDDGHYYAVNSLKDFDPTTPSGNSNFGTDTESEKDNSHTRELIYAQAVFDKGYSGGYATITALNQLYGGIVGGVLTPGSEFSGFFYGSNRGAVAFTEVILCDVFDAYRFKLQAVEDNGEYTIISTRTSPDEWPYYVYISGDEGNFTDENGSDNLPIIVEYATGYVDNSYLASQGGDVTVAHGEEVVRECSDANITWTDDFESIKDANDGLGVTKMRVRLKPGYKMPPGANMYVRPNFEVRRTDLATGAPLRPGDLLVNYAAFKVDYRSNWVAPTFIPNVYPEDKTGYRGARYAVTGARAQITKTAGEESTTLGDEVSYRLHVQFWDDTKSTGNSGELRVIDVLPKEFSYVDGSTLPEEIGEPQIGDCDDAADMEIACVDGENQVLIWDYGSREINSDIPDLNYTVLIGALAQSGENTNYVKVESPLDITRISDRMDEAVVTVDVPASISISKETEENDDYPSPRERITDEQDIFFLINLRNGKDENASDLDIIDVLPFEGDGEDGALLFNDFNFSRNIPTAYHGSMVFHTIELSQHPDSSATCDINADDGVKYYYTNEDPTQVNLAPTVGDANDLGNPATSIWCEGDENGPNGCTITSSGFTFTSNSQVTAIRAKGAEMESQAICQLHIHLSVDDNLAGDYYSNTAGASATGVSLPILSNSISVPIVGSTLSGRVWYDANHNGIQDTNETSLNGIEAHLLDDSGAAVTNPLTGSAYIVTTDSNGSYAFVNLNHGSYQVRFASFDGYVITAKQSSSDATRDSDVNPDTNTTDMLTLDVDSNLGSIDLGLYIPYLSGRVYDDGNADGIINGTAISAPDGVPLYVTLLDDEGNVVAGKALESNGTYFFDHNDGLVANANYTIVLTTTQNDNTATLPAGWIHADGEHIGTDAGTDGAADGKIAVALAEADIMDINFGIDKKPLAQDQNASSQANPGGDTRVDVPTLEGNDTETPDDLNFSIVSLPDNATLYCDGTEIKSNDLNKSCAADKLTVDPDDGDQNVSFKFVAIDPAGAVSDPATVQMPFTGIALSGNIFDDGDGDDDVDGTPIFAPDGKQLYVTLLKGSDVISSQAVASDGSYRFPGSVNADTNYTVILTTTPEGTSPALPATWNHTGEAVNSADTPTKDSSSDGNITVKTGTVDLTQVDFGINKQPVADDLNVSPQANPGGDTRVAVPALPVSDREDGTPATITIDTLPDEGTLYYDGTAVSAGQTIDDFNSSKLSVDPNAGDADILFTYHVTDAAGIASATATVHMPFSGLGLSGHLWDDGDGNTDNRVDGTAISAPEGTQLYAVILDSNHTVVASKAIASDGRYTFTDADGITPESNYTVIIADDPAATEPALPETWHFTGEESNNTGTGDDGQADGILAVSIGEIAVLNNDFGINKQPVASDLNADVQSNPSGDTRYPVPALPVSDKEDGIPTTITIQSLPDATTMGTLYYDGVAVTVGQVIADYDPAKLTVDPVNANPAVVFTYTATDAAGMESDPATVTMPFLGDIYVGDYVWTDSNGNGLQDPEEAPAIGVKVTLYALDGTALATTQTDDDGIYSFKVEKPGDYYLVFDPTRFYTIKNSDGTSRLSQTATIREDDSDADPLTGKTGTIHLDWGDRYMSMDAGIAPLAHIGDTFWIDKNRDGEQDADEPAVVGAKVELLDINGKPVLDNNGQPLVTTTDANGYYGFDVPADQKYLVRFTIPQEYLEEGYTFTDPDNGDNTVNENGIIEIPVYVESGQNYLTLDAGITCGCEDTQSDSGDALSLFALLLMGTLTLLSGLLLIRRENAI